MLLDKFIWDTLACAHWHDAHSGRADVKYEYDGCASVQVRHL